MFAGLLAGPLLCLSPAATVHAANPYLYDVIGFADGIFFFEVFGVFDIIGGGHSTIYAIDLENDKWLPGTPVRTFVGDGHPEQETVTLAEIRRRNWEQFAPILAAHEPLDFGRPVARRVLGQIGTPPREFSWQIPYWWTLPSFFPGIHVLRLDEFEIGTTDPIFRDTRCLGYALNYNGTEIYRDTEVPASRGCPVAYELEEIVCTDFAESCVVLIAVYNIGFEGRDRDIIAAPFRMEL